MEKLGLLKILDTLISDLKISNNSNFGQGFVQNSNCPKVLVINGLGPNGG